VRPTGLIFTGVTGGPTPSSQPVSVSDLSSSPRAFTSGQLTTDPAQWLNSTPLGSTVQPNQPTTIQVQPNVSGLTNGVRRGVVTLLFTDGSVRNVNVLLVLSTGGTSAPAKSGREASAGCSPTQLLPVFSSLDDQFSVSTSWPTPIEVTVVDDCGSPLTAGSVIATFSNGDPPLRMVSLKDGRWTGTWQPRSTAFAEVTVNVSAESQDGSVSGTAQRPGAVIANNNAPEVDSVGASSLIAPGSVVTILGARLATPDSQQPPLTTNLGGASVLLAGELLPLFSTSDGQIVAQAPYDLAPNTSQQHLVVQRGTSVAVPVAVSVAAAQPLILSILDGQTTLDPDHAALAGDTLTLNCTGLGAVDPPVAAGVPAPSAPISQVTSPVTVTVGGVVATFNSATLTPGMSGSYQVSVTLPGGIPSGAAQVVLSLAGQSSPPATISIQ
jgi:uncharacterized protein (TIGR03437 family)